MEKPLVIYGELYSLKNSKRIFYKKNGVPFITSSGVCREHKGQLLASLAEKKAEFIKMIDGKKYPLRIVFRIYRATRRRFDYINIIQQLCDCMVAVGYLPDDDANHLIPIFVEYKVDKNNPRVEMEVL